MTIHDPAATPANLEPLSPPSNTSPRFLRDIEVADLEALDLASLARSLTHGILLAELPFRIALFGPWGSGKSTILRSVQQLLDAGERERVVTLWFNPWGYGSGADLLHNLMLAIAGLIPGNDHSQHEDHRVVEAGIEALQALRPQQLGGPSLPPPHDASLKGGGHAFASDRLRSLRNAFHDLVETALGHAPGRLVIFIDDLDKCPPDAALSFVECCKLFFSSDSRLVAVFALDNQVLANAIALKYGQQRRFDPDHYTEKVFEFSYQVPPISWHRLDSLVENFYHRVHLGSDLDEAAQREQIEAIAQTLRRPGLVLTPRRLKHIFNRFIWFFTAIEWLPKAKEIETSLWLTWLLICECWRSFRQSASVHGVELLGEVCNRVTGNLLFPHSNEAARAGLDEQMRQRALLDYFRHIFSDVGDIHAPETQDLIREMLLELIEINRILRAHGV